MLTTPAPPLLAPRACGGPTPQDLDVFRIAATSAQGNIASLLPRPNLATQGLPLSHEQQPIMMDQPRHRSVPTNEMMRESTLRLMAERRGSLCSSAPSCSPPISPGSAMSAGSPLREASPCPSDYAPICTVGEPSVGGNTTTYLSNSAAINISRYAFHGQGIPPTSSVSLPVHSSVGVGSLAMAQPSPTTSVSSPESFAHHYLPPTPPAETAVASALIDDIDEYLSDSAASPFNDLDQLDSLLESEEALMTKLSHPPPLICKPGRVPEFEHGLTDVSPASIMMMYNGQAQAHSSLSSMPITQSYMNDVNGPMSFPGMIKKEEPRQGKGEVYPVVALWEFLLEALYYPCYEHILRWRNKQEGHFKIVDSQSLAKLWGLYKRKREMNFDKMSRAMRYYYDKGILEKGGSGARLEYKFGPRSNWLDFRPPPGSKPGRFFNPQPPRRGRGRSSVASTSALPVQATTPPLRHDEASFFAMGMPSGYGPQRSFHTFNAGMRHTPY